VLLDELSVELELELSVELLDEFTELLDDDDEF